MDHGLNERSKELSTRQAADYLNLSYYYLRNMRHLLHKHDGPKYIFRIDNGYLRCFYKLEDLKEWKESHSYRKTKNQ